jgi:hypothetical protein
VTGFLDIHGARQFLGNRSLSWLRLHVHEIPHLKLYDRLLFDPAELRAWVTATAERHNPIDIDAVVAEVMRPARKGRAAR